MPAGWGRLTAARPFTDARPLHFPRQYGREKLRMQLKSAPVPATNSRGAIRRSVDGHAAFRHTSPTLPRRRATGRGPLPPNLMIRRNVFQASVLAPIAQLVEQVTLNH